MSFGISGTHLYRKSEKHFKPGTRSKCVVRCVCTGVWCLKSAPLMSSNAQESTINKSKFLCLSLLRVNMRAARSIRKHIYECALWIRIEHFILRGDRVLHLLGSSMCDKRRRLEGLYVDILMRARALTDVMMMRRRWSIVHAPKQGEVGFYMLGALL